MISSEKRGKQLVKTENCCWGLPGRQWLWAVHHQPTLQGPWTLSTCSATLSIALFGEKIWCCPMQERSKVWEKEEERAFSLLAHRTEDPHVLLLSLRYGDIFQGTQLQPLCSLKFPSAERTARSQSYRQLCRPRPSALKRVIKLVGAERCIVQQRYVTSLSLRWCSKRDNIGSFPQPIHLFCLNGSWIARTLTINTVYFVPQ